jgi:outer membrane protein assembly factor BamC
VRGLLSKAFDTLYSTSERDKYRTRLDRTADGNGTEIYISHRGMVEVYTTRETQNPGSPGATAWQPREPDPELEAEYLRRLMVRLGAQEEKARALMASAGAPAQPNPQSQQPAQPERAQIRKGVDGLEALEVAEPFDRVWRRVGLALDRGGFTVEDRDRQKGIYFVRYADPEVEKDTRGLLTRWFSSDSKVKAQQYRVQITQAGTASQVNVLNKDGAADSSKTAQRILTLLHEQLK